MTEEQAMRPEQDPPAPAVDREPLERAQEALADARSAAHDALGDLPGMEEAGPETETGQQEAEKEDPDRSA